MLVRMLMVAALATGLACAQDDMGGGRGMSGGGMGGRGGSGMGEGMGGGGAMPRPQRQSKPEMLAEKLKLKNDQKSEAEKILSAAMERATPVRNAINQQRQLLVNAILSKAGDDQIKKALADYTAMSAQMTGIEADAFAKLYAILKPNQQAKAAQAFEIMAGMFTPNMGGGGGRNFGRGNRGGGQ
ncbi:MAG TPA: hypothetical protein VKE70_14060 [Candidatus Solibacter sp.]|nr:hypothetical protein [Candidatus Solibacter sp.]